MASIDPVPRKPTCRRRPRGRSNSTMPTAHRGSTRIRSGKLSRPDPTSQSSCVSHKNHTGDSRGPWGDAVARCAISGCCRNASMSKSFAIRSVVGLGREAGRDVLLGLSATGTGRVQRHGGANKSLERFLVEFLALMQVDGAPGVAIEAGVEQPHRIVQRGPLGKGHLHNVLVRLAGADYSVVRPHRDASPLPLLDHLGVGLLDACADLRKHLAPPVAELLDPPVDQQRWRLFCRRTGLLHVALLTFVWRVAPRARSDSASVTISSTMRAAGGRLRMIPTHSPAGITTISKSCRALASA